MTSLLHASKTLYSFQGIGANMCFLTLTGALGVTTERLRERKIKREIMRKKINENKRRSRGRTKERS